MCSALSTRSGPDSAARGSPSQAGDAFFRNRALGVRSPRLLESGLRYAYAIFALCTWVLSMSPANAQPAQVSESEFMVLGSGMDRIVDDFADSRSARSHRLCNYAMEALLVAPTSVRPGAFRVDASPQIWRPAASLRSRLARSYGRHG